MNMIRIEPQLVGNGSYGIYKDHDPITVFHVIDDSKGYGTFATKREAQKALANAKSVSLEVKGGSDE